MQRRTVVSLLLAGWATPALAFCGFFVAGSNAKLENHASQVALVRQGQRTMMTLQNNYQGPPENFAMVVPVPVVLQKDDVKTLPQDVFDHLDALSAPRLVEYWEQDPCFIPPVPTPVPMRMMAAGVQPPMVVEKGAPVQVLARYAVGEYEVVILGASESTALERWLKQHHYKLPSGAAAALAPYVRDRMKFFVAKVDISKVKRDANGVVALSPLRFGFDSPALRLPVRLGLLNANGKQDLIIYVLHPSSRFEVANYPNAFVPTNLDVTDEVREKFAPFYAQLFDQTLGQSGGKAVVTEYSWQTSSCDPCPAPPLQDTDLLTLGANVASTGTDARRFFPGFSSWVLTRLHTRYDPKALTADLLFREAKPVVGGRSNWDGNTESLDASPSSENNFQNRYIIRHRWEAKVTCDNPRWNQWGGPPNGAEPATLAAKHLATVERAPIDLRRVVNSPVPRLGLSGHNTVQHHN